MFNADKSDRLTGEFTKIVVGNAEIQQEFFVHKRLLCERSQYFCRMLQGGFREAREGVVSMPEDCPLAFEVFVNWLYAGFVPSLSPKLVRSSSRITLLVKFHVLAEKLILPETVKAAVLDHILYLFKQRERFLLSDLKYVLRNTLDDCPMRALVKDMFCYEILLPGNSNQREHKDQVITIMQVFHDEEKIELLTELLLQAQHGFPKDFTDALQDTENADDPTLYDLLRVNIKGRSRYQTGYLKLRDKIRD